MNSVLKIRFPKLSLKRKNFTKSKHSNEAKVSPSIKEEKSVDSPVSDWTDARSYKGYPPSQDHVSESHSQREELIRDDIGSQFTENEHLVENYNVEHGNAGPTEEANSSVSQNNEELVMESGKDQTQPKLNQTNDLASSLEESQTEQYSLDDEIKEALSLIRIPKRDTTVKFNTYLRREEIVPRIFNSVVGDRACIHANHQSKPVKRFKSRGSKACLHVAEDCSKCLVRSHNQERQGKYSSHVRIVSCPDQGCKVQVNLDAILSHIHSAHPFAQWLGELEAYRFYKQCWNIKSETNFDLDDVSWVLTLWSFDGNIFASVFEKSNHLWYYLIYVLGDERVAARYVYRVWIQGPVKSINYQGKVHSICCEKKKIQKSEDCLVLKNTQISRLMTKTGLSYLRESQGYDYRLPVYYSIARATGPDPDQEEAESVLFRRHK